jgi:mannose-1-phosphate guanylyltransferase
LPASTRSSSTADGFDVDRLWITVLAGGIGSRFWPVSTPARPKQLLPLASERPLIVDTVERARSLVPDERLRILTGRGLVEPFRSIVEDLGPEALLVEPRARGTAPVLTWAAWTVARRDPSAVLVSLHSDHLIRPLDTFRHTVLGAAAVADREDLLLSLGARPDRAETGYGYVQPGDALEAPGGLSAHRVRAFHEKPDRVTAARYVAEGYLWNTGIFVWKASVLLDEVERHAPEIAEHLPRLEEGDVERYFESVPRISVDVALMERSGRVGVVEGPFEWDDVGAWHALHRTRTPGLDGNVVLGEGLVHEGRDNVVFADEGRVVLFGVDDLVVVRSGDVTLVTRRGRSADLKDLLDHLPPEYRESP